MDHGQVAFRFFGVAAQIKRIVPVAHCFDSSINLQTISPYCRAFGDIFGHEIGVGITFAANIHDAKAEASSINQFLDRHAAGMMLIFGSDFFRFFPQANLNAANYARFAIYPVFLTTRWSTNDAFIDFDRVLAANSVAFRADHACPKFMEDLESSFVAGQAKLALELESRLAGC